MQDTDFTKLQSVFADVFNLAPEEVTLQTQFGELPAWDSMGHMDLMVALETAFGIEITAETISALISVPAILEHIQSKHG
ncbi:MAG TPA: acyl carrier protein [Anaerolineales bacterium]|nr:acyl carrier protein [Anaerolineales bacterium]HRQ92497.1 acyl carrier protein [Anaerolineales bacterium]